jgi:hypothetical protein
LCSVIRHRPPITPRNGGQKHLLMRQTGTSSRPKAAVERPLYFAVALAVASFLAAILKFQRN